MEIRCSVLNCETTSSTSKVFYKFPVDFDISCPANGPTVKVIKISRYRECDKEIGQLRSLMPNSKLYVFESETSRTLDRYRDKTWVQNTGNDKLWQEFSYGGAQPFLEKSVCSDHFLDIDFIVFGEPNSGLRPDAVPFLINVKREAKALDTPVSIIDMEDTNSNSSTFEAVSPITDLKRELVTTGSADESFTLCSPGDNSSQSTTSDADADIIYFKQEPDPIVLVPCSTSNLKNVDTIKPCTVVGPKKRRSKRTTSNAVPDIIYIKQDPDLIVNTIEPCTVIDPKKHKSKGTTIICDTETEEEIREKREKNRIRAAEKRKNMTPEEREIWRMKNKIQTRERRKREPELTKIMRRYNNAIRASLKRSEETPEQRMARRLKDALRAAERRKMETEEERERRLQRDRERVTLRRLDQRLSETPEQREERLRIGREKKYMKRRGLTDTCNILEHNIFSSIIQMDTSLIGHKEPKSGSEESSENMEVFLKMEPPQIDIEDVASINNNFAAYNSDINNTNSDKINQGNIESETRIKAEAPKCYAKEP